MKKRRHDLFFGMLIALSLHVAVAIGIGALAALHREVRLPVFRQGESAIELTLEPVLVPEPRPAPERQPEEPLDKPPQEPEPEEIAIEDEKDPEPQLEEQEQLPEPMIADMEEKGVETVDPGKTDVNPRYPLGAQMRGEEGVVRVRFTVGKGGSVINVKVVKSSGYPSLDNAAADAVRRASFRNVAGLSLQGRTEELTIKFELRER